jgi:hypothetical protein
LELGESRSLTEFTQRNLQKVSRRLWANAHALGPRLMEVVMMLMVLDGDRDGAGDDTENT